MTTVSVRRAISQSDAAFRALNAVPIEQLTACELRTLARAFGELAAANHDLQLRLLGRLHRSSIPAAFGRTSAAAALSKHMGISMAEARGRISEAIAKGYG